MKLITLALLLVAALGAQTKTAINQLASEATGDNRLFLQASDGKLQFVRIDPATLELVPAVGSQPPVLRAIAAGPPVVEKVAVLTRATDGSYTLPDVPVGGSVKVYRNGSLQSPVANPNLPASAADYTITANVIRGSTAAGWQPTDMIIAVYSK